MTVLRWRSWRKEIEMDADLTSPAGKAATAHTPGPWSYCQNERDQWAGAIRIVGGDGFRVASLDNTKHERSQEVHNANARLIAAAPALLAELSALCARIDRLYEGGQIEQRRTQSARAAIRGATGEQA
jgi:hypothetical protein